LRTAVTNKYETRISYHLHILRYLIVFAIIKQNMSTQDHNYNATRTFFLILRYPV